MEMLVLSNLRLIDGTGHEPVENIKIVVNGNRIADIGLQVNYPENARVVNLKGLTVMPGLIDCHLHLGGFTIDKPGRPMGKVYFRDLVSFTWDYLRNFARRRKLSIENGVTTIRSAGDNYPHIIRLRDKINSNKLVGPRIFAAGPTFTAVGGHPASTIYKGNRYIVEHATRQVGDSHTAREEVKKLADGGVDCIKAIYSKTNPMDLSQEVPQLALDVLESIVDEAHKHKLCVMVHTGSQQQTRDAIAAGADSIEHGILPGEDSTDYEDDTVSIMVERGTFFVPTLAIAWAYQNMYPDVFKRAKEAVKKLHDGGVKIALGTDSGSPGVVIGSGAHKELELMVDAGLSTMDSIVIGTRNAAENLGKGSELGTIEKGKLADMIVVQDDPLSDISNSRNVVLVIKEGKIVYNQIEFF